MEDDNWDLSAVVRSCQPSEPAAGTRDARWLFPPPAGPVLAVEGGKGGAFMRLTDVFGSRAGVPEMGELCNSSFPGGRQPPQLQEGSTWSPRLAAAATAAGLNQTPPRRKADRPASQTTRSRRRKNQLKKVVRHVAADGLSSDTWAWRKYGQKPIKGSPYPRGYYRCSSSKGCPARKQVERSRTDPATFIVTYTSDHNHPMPTHRNSLAGSTRHKFPSPGTAAASGGDHPEASNSEASLLSLTIVPELSPTTPRPLSEDIVDEEEVGEEEDDDEGELLVEDMEVMGEDDLLFLSSEEGGAASATAFINGEEGFEDHLFPLPWPTSHCINTATSAAAEAFFSS